MQHGEYRHPRLVAVYDAAYRWARDDDFFLALVDEKSGSRVLDLGCGTGRLTIGLAAAGHRVTGVDPAAASLDAARAKHGAAEVEWIEGTSDSLPDGTFDVALMTSHVAQLFVDDAQWSRVLGDLHRALVPGGRLTFDARNPDARDWQRWNPVDSRRVVELPDGASVDVSTEVTDVAAGTVTFTHHYDFGVDQLRSSATLRFRSEAELRASLRDAGFRVEDVLGGWRRQPVGPDDDGELLVTARR